MAENGEQAPLPAVRNVELDRLARLGTWLALLESGKESDEAHGAGAALRLYYAESLELPPLAATELSVIKGRLTCSAKLLRALAIRGGYRVVRADENEHGVTAALVAIETGEEIGRATYTLEDAKRAGISDRPQWKTYPRRMLWARASKFVVDDYAPQLALGLLVEEEADEIVNPPAPPVAADVEEIPFGEEDAEFDQLGGDEEYEAAQQLIEENTG